MAYVAVDKDGTEVIAFRKPKRVNGKYWEHKIPIGWSYDGTRIEYDIVYELPKGSIKKLIGRALTWDDEPVELKEE